MKNAFYAAAAVALLLASPAAQARGFSFNIDGQKIRIAAPRNCMSLSCLSVTDNGSTIGMKNLGVKRRKASDDVEVASDAPQAAPSAPPAPAVEAQPAPAPAANTAPFAPLQVAANNVPAAPAPAAETSRERLTNIPSTPPARATSTAPAVPTAATVVNAAPPAPPVQQQAAAPATTPFGLWQTDEGNVRVEQCGANLCGFAEKSNERILINMKPSGEKWTGRIHDPDSGSNYDSIIAMKGPNLLKVQGCAFGGLFCGGQTWKRIS